MTEHDSTYEAKLRLRRLQSSRRQAIEGGEEARAERLSASIARLREEITAKPNERSATMATKTKSTKKAEQVEQVEQGPSKEEREARRQEQLEQLAERIRENLVEDESIYEVTREALDDLKPNAQVAALMKSRHGLQYGRREGKGTWRLPATK